MKKKSRRFVPKKGPICFPIVGEAAGAEFDSRTPNLSLWRKVLGTSAARYWSWASLRLALHSNEPQAGIYSFQLYEMSEMKCSNCSPHAASVPSLRKLSLFP